MRISETRAYEAIGRTLVGRVEVCFGLAGSDNFAFLNALHAAGVAFYSSRHECGADAMTKATRRGVDPYEYRCRALSTRQSLPITLGPVVI
jgi:hypothetical protein